MSLNDLKFGPEPGCEREHILRELMYKAEDLGEQARMESADRELDMSPGSKMQNLVDEAMERGLNGDDIAKFADAWKTGWNNRNTLLELVEGDRG